MEELSKKEIKGYRKRIKRAFAERRNSIFFSERLQKMANYGYYILSIWTGVKIAYFFLLLAKGQMGESLGTTEIIQDLIELTRNLIGIVALNIGRKSAPEDEKKREDWIYRNGLRFNLLLAAFFLLTMVNLLFMADMHESSRLITLLLSMCSLTMLGYIIVILSIIQNNDRFVSGIYTGFGSGLVIFGYLLINIGVTVFLFGQGEDASLTIFAFWGIILFHSIKRIADIFASITDRGELNVVQYNVLRVIRPWEILGSLRQRKKRYDNKLRALEIATHFEKKKNYAVGVEVLKILDEKYGRKQKQWLGLIGAVLLGIIGTILSEILLDVVYGPFINPILCSLGIAAC